MLGAISIYDVNEALPRALPLLHAHGRPVTAASVANARPTIEWPGLFVTEYMRPARNVLFDPIRDANPFFHYLEALWIIQGRNDVAFLKHLLPRMAEYSDDGQHFHGAYGFRLRRWVIGNGPDMDFVDQVEVAINILREAPASRQVVMSIWDPSQDLGAKTKDMPCNDMIMLKVRNGALNITVNNRSNDTVLGCYGANAVQFSMLQMYMAAKLGLNVGTYYQVSDSFHVYEDNPYWQWFKAEYARDPNRWALPLEQSRRAYAGIGDRNLFENNVQYLDNELNYFFEAADAAITGDNAGLITDQDFHHTATRDAALLWNSLHAYRQGDFAAAQDHLHMMTSTDWQLAAQQWITRRLMKKGLQT